MYDNTYIYIFSATERINRLVEEKIWIIKRERRIEIERERECEEEIEEEEKGEEAKAK